MIEVNGGLEIAATGSSVLDFLSPKNISKCLPNLQEFNEMDQNNFQAVFKIELPQSLGVSYLQNLSVRMTFTMSNAQDGVVLKGEGRTAGIRIRLFLNVKVVPKERSSLLEYEGQVDTGLIEKFLGKERLESMTRDISTKIVSCISRTLQDYR